MFDMKYKFKLLWAFALVFALSSCGDMFDLDINVDPNNPQTTSPNLLLTNIQRQMAYHINGYSSNAMGFMGMIGNYDSWQIGQSAFNGTWSTAYSSVLKDIEGIIQTNTGDSGSPQYLGIAQLLKAYLYTNMVDFFGDIPFSEALRGDDASGVIKNPKFDDDEAIYAECLKLVDQGIANVTSTRVPVAVGGDVIYGGSAARWAKFGRTLKMRLLLNTRLVNSAAAKSGIEALMATPANLIAADADDFSFGYSRIVTPDNRHPWYQSSYTGPNGFTYILHQIMLEMLEDGDPRFPYYFKRQTAVVLDQNDPSQRNTTPCSQAACLIGYFALSPVVQERLYTSQNIPYTAAAKTYMAGMFGRDRGDPSGVPLDGDLRTVPGVYPCGGYYDNAASLTGANRAPGGGVQPMITHVHALYYQIEAILALGVAGDARALFEKAIRDHIKKVVDFGRSRDANAVAPPITLPDGRVLNTDSYVAKWMARYDAATTANAKLNVVAKQLWFSSWGTGIDVYNLFRRTGLPNTLQDPLFAPRKFPLRYPYPQEELTLNPNASNYKTVIYDRDPIFWDK